MENLPLAVVERTRRVTAGDRPWPAGTKVAEARTAGEQTVATLTVTRTS